MLSTDLIALQRFDEARQIVHDAQSRTMIIRHFTNALFALAFVGTDSAATAEQQKVVCGQARVWNWGLSLRVRHRGVCRPSRAKARELTKRAVSTPPCVRQQRRRAIYLAIRCSARAAYGNPAQARQSGAEALKAGSRESGRRKRSRGRLCDGGRYDTSRVFGTQT